MIPRKTTIPFLSIAPRNPPRPPAPAGALPVPVPSSVVPVNPIGRLWPVRLIDAVEAAQSSDANPESIAFRIRNNLLLQKQIDSPEAETGWKLKPIRQAS